METKKDINNLLESYLNGTMSDEKKASVGRAVEIDAKKSEAWKMVKKQTLKRNSIGRIMMRYAAIMMPFLVIGLVWAGEIKGLFGWGDSENVATENVDENKNGTLDDDMNIHIRFEAADLKDVTETLMANYPEIKGLKSTIGKDTIKVTTRFDNQKLTDVLEELNIHFGHNFRLDSDGNLVISD